MIVYSPAMFALARDGSNGLTGLSAGKEISNVELDNSRKLTGPPGSARDAAVWPVMPPDVGVRATRWSHDPGDQFDAARKVVP